MRDASFLRHKTAHIHLVRTGGTWVTRYLTKALRPLGVTVANSWEAGFLDRDWNRKEVHRWSRYDAACHIHNHVASWDESLVHHLKRRGFLVFAFVRDVGDQLCSLYHWIKRKDPGWQGVSLDTFIKEQISGCDCNGFNFRHWEIPPYWRDLDCVAPFDRRGVNHIFSRLGISLPEDTDWEHPVNTTDNPGFRQACLEGLISKSTQAVLERSEFVKRYREVCRTSESKSKRAANS